MSTNRKRHQGCRNAAGCTVAKARWQTDIKDRKVQNKTGNRRLFVIDIENYCGKPVLCEADVTAARRSVFERFSLTVDDLVVIGTSHTGNCVTAGFAWPGARQVFMRGHDGADHALLNALGEYQLERFGEMVLLSGDGIFAETVQQIAKAGTSVTIASQGRCLSRCLAAVAPRVQLVSARSLAGHAA